MAGILQSNGSLQQKLKLYYLRRITMKKNSTLFVWILLSLLALILTACSVQVKAGDTVNLTPTANPVPVQPTSVQQTYSDPFAYCAAVGTIDTPNARYTGPQINDEIINGFKIAAGLEASPAPKEMFEKMTIWRCMDGQVYACNFGANLPCSSKANTDKTPSLAMEDYCKANPDSVAIPMSVTGHSTIYSWHCVKDTPELLNQIENVDAAGYLTQIWYLIAPNASPKPEISATSTPPGGSSQILFSSNRGGFYDDLYLMDLTSSQITHLTSGDSNTFPGPFSPDGTRLLFTGFGLTHSYVGLMNADGSQPQDLSQNPDSDEGFPAWSPDGKTIAFTSRRDGNNEIYIMNADGSEPKCLTNSPKDDFAPAWSPDGSQIAFVSDRDQTDGMYSIYVMNADGSKVTRLTDNKGINYTPVWSPDGKQIAFRSSLNGSSEIYVIHVDGSGMTNLTNNQAEDWSPSWSPDGKLIAFQTNRDGNWEIYFMNADGTNPHNLTNNPANDQMPYWK
jgi:Tol biopolymer transport system component